MSVYGLTGSPSRCCLRTPVGGLGSLKQVSALPSSWKPKDKITIPCLERYCLIITGWSIYLFLMVNIVSIFPGKNKWWLSRSWFFPLLQSYRNCWLGSAQGCKKQQTHTIKCTMGASYGDTSNGSTGNIWFIDNCIINMGTYSQLIMQKILLRGHGYRILVKYSCLVG